MTGRTADYINEVVVSLNSWHVPGADRSYQEVHQLYLDTRRYLQTISKDHPELIQYSEDLPDLIRPSLLNQGIDLLPAFFVTCVSNPFLLILFTAATAPVSIPVIIARLIVIKRTKSRTQQAAEVLQRILRLTQDSIP